MNSIEKIIFKSAETEDIEGILTLQKANTKSVLKSREIEHEGFVTIEHDKELLSRMNTPYPHTIACYNGRVVGYALSMLPYFRDEVVVLRELFKKLETLNHNNIPILKTRFIIMGQVCIDKKFRKKGIFRNLYKEMAARMKDNFDLIVTEIANENQRSVNAHLAAGFKIIHQYVSSKNEVWIIVGLDLTDSL